LAVTDRTTLASTQRCSLRGLVATFFLKMLQSDYVCVRKHAFELLYNLSVHLNLLHRKTHEVENMEFMTPPAPGQQPPSICASGKWQANSCMTFFFLNKGMEEGKKN
jgi:hypothetical protein